MLYKITVTYKFLRDKFHGFRGQLVICKLLIFEISLTKNWLASIGEQDMYEQLLFDTYNKQ